MKIIVCSPKDRHLQKQLWSMNKAYFSTPCEVHFVHIFNGLLNEKISQETISAQIIENLKEIGTNILSGIQGVKVEYHCLFDPYPKRKMVDYLKESKADLVITSTSDKHGIEGLFMSSFTDYLLKFSPCDVLAVRPSKV